MKSNQMRLQKLLVISLIAVLLALAACSGGTTTPAVPQPSLPAAPTPVGTDNVTGTASTPTQTAALESSSLPHLKVHFIDVGQGDSILIDLGEVEILIDGGDRRPGVVNYLSSFVEGAIEVMVATHTHADHIGGLVDVLAKYQVNDIWLNGDTATSATFKNFMNLVNAEGAAIHQAERGNTVQIGNLKLTVLNPAKPLFSDANNNSIVLCLSYGDIDFLFTGDAEREAEGSMLVQSVVPVPDVEILKVGHHGSRTSSSPQFLNTVKPEVAIYMCGAGNTYGHPHQETIVALNNIGAKVYGTDVHGTIVVITDGKIYDVQLQKQAAR